MKRVISLATLLISIFIILPSLQAQRKVDFWVTPGAEGWNIVHKVAKGETIFMLARRYHVPPAILADANGASYNDGLKENSSVIVPLGAYNMQTIKPVNMGEARALYYKVRPEDNLYRISRHTAVPQRTLAQWNNMTEREVQPGQTLLVGWILYDATQTSPPAAAVNQPPVRTATVISRAPAAGAHDTPKYVMRSAEPAQPAYTPVVVPAADTDTVTAPPLPPIEALFKEQTQDGQNIAWEKGSAAFFALSSKASGADVFAFHNKAAKGAVIRVKNLNNGRVIFVKVLGPLPLTKQYYGCIIGLSGQAKAKLGVREAKAFCELSYAGY